jgi:hypothetical protein
MLSVSQRKKWPIERREYMTPTEMQEKAMKIFGEGLH